MLVKKTLSPLLALLLALLACARADLPVEYSTAGAPGALTPGALTPGEPQSSPVASPFSAPTPTEEILPTPTLDPPHASAFDRTDITPYIIQSGDSLSIIGARFGVSAEDIGQANGLTITDTLEVGNTLMIPLASDAVRGPNLKLIPDSELVYGPAVADFDLAQFVQARGGYLAHYMEDVPGVYIDGRADSVTVTGIEIVRLVATRYSVNPRLLLAVLEYQSGWVTQPEPRDSTLAFPLRYVDVNRQGLLRQLSWAANQLNYGYYSWRVNGLSVLVFDTQTIKVIAPGLNAGTVAIQHFFSKLLGLDDWTIAVSEQGLSRTYRVLFGNPFKRAVEPLIPTGLQQPPLALPFEPGVVWAFTGGPHGAWDTGSAWAALDFAPPMDVLGCFVSEQWATAMLSGVIARAEYGSVIIDQDGDGNEGTGWTVLNLHLASQDRVEAGTRVQVGDRLGHPSCEGGVSNGTHVHIARKYNGEWIPADGGWPAIPFVMEGWTAAGLGREYDGTLTNATGDRRLEACDCRAPENEISK